MVMQWWQIHQPKQITNERRARKIKEPNKSVKDRKEKLHSLKIETNTHKPAAGIPPVFLYHNNRTRAEYAHERKKNCIQIYVHL